MAERKVTLNLNQMANDDLNELLAMTGDNMTDITNKAIRVYKFVQKHMQENDGYLTLVNSAGEKERLYIL